MFRGPAGGLAEAAIRREAEALRRGVLHTAADAGGDVAERFDVVALHVDDADGDVFTPGDGFDQLQFAELAAGHLDVDLVDIEVEEGGEHRGVLSWPDGAAFVVAEAEMGGETAAADGGGDGAIEDIDEADWILTEGVAAHGGLVHRDLRAAGVEQAGELGLHDGEERLGDGPAILVGPAGLEAAAEGVGAGHAGLEGEAGRGETAEALELFDGAKTARGKEFASDGVLTALIVRGRAEAPRGALLGVDALEVAIEGEIEIEARLLAIGDDVEAGRGLIVNGGEDGVVLEFGDVVGAEFVEMAGGKLEPCREGIAADDGGAQGARLHSIYQCRGSILAAEGEIWMRLIVGLLVLAGFAAAQQYPQQYPPGQYPPGQYPPGQYPPGQYPGGSGGGLPIPKISWPKRKPKEEKKDEKKSEVAVAESEVNGKLVRLSEKELVLEIAEGKEQKFRLLAKTKFEDEDGEAVRDSLLQPGDRLSVRVAEIDPETAIRVVRLKPGTGPGAGGATSASVGGNEELIEGAREGAKSFVSSLPDYAADMTATRFYSQSNNPPKWQQIDAATAQVVRKNGREEFLDVLVNGKPWTRPSEHVKEWAATEFFNTLDVVLLPGMEPAFVKRGSEKVGGKTLQVFESSVKAEDSNWVVVTEDGSQHKSAYKARVWIDPESRRAFKVEQKAVGLPASFLLERTETTVEFGFVKLGSGTVLAPVRGENVVCRRGGGSCSKSAVEIRNYR